MTEPENHPPVQCELHPYVGVKLLRARYQPGRVTPDAELEDGYGVIYSNGYESWSPKKAFDDAHQPTQAMSFGRAMEVARLGFKIRRPHWQEPSYVYYESHEDRSRPDAYIVVVPWNLRMMGYEYIPRAPDMVACDWQMVVIHPQLNQQGSSLK